MRQITDSIAVEIKELWETGASSKQIQDKFGLGAACISQHVKRKGLKRPDGVSARSTIVIKDGLFLCSKCGDWKEPTNYQKNNCNNFMGYCRDCRNSYELSRIMSDPDIWINQKLNQYRHRANREKLPFGIDAAYVKELYEKQDKKCFYSDIPLAWGHTPQNKQLSLSIDKVVPSKGYVKGNVVLAQTRINGAKGDFSLEEMKMWMPEWYRRIMSCEWLNIGENNENMLV